jgi:hypothetical protein
LLLDYPSNPTMLSVDLPLRTRGGRVERLTAAGRVGQFGLPRVAEELYQSARRLRVFTARPVARDLTEVRRLVEVPAAELAALLGRDEPLLRG